MKILEFPGLRQTYSYDCGAKALQSILAYYGIDVAEDDIMEDAKTTKKFGTPIKGIMAAAKKYGLKSKCKKMSIDEVKKFIDRKTPVILVLQAWTFKKKVNWKKDWSDGHYAVAIGYDKNRIYFEDPSSFKRTYLTFAQLKKRWHDVCFEDQECFNYGIAVYGKKPKFSFRAVEHMD